MYSGRELPFSLDIFVHQEGHLKVLGTVWGHGTSFSRLGSCSFAQEGREWTITVEVVAHRQHRWW